MSALGVHDDSMFRRCLMDVYGLATISDDWLLFGSHWHAYADIGHRAVWPFTRRPDHVFRDPYSVAAWIDGAVGWACLWYPDVYAGRDGMWFPIGAAEDRERLRQENVLAASLGGSIYLDVYLRMVSAFHDVFVQAVTEDECDAVHATSMTAELPGELSCPWPMVGSVAAAARSRPPADVGDDDLQRLPASISVFGRGRRP